MVCIPRNFDGKTTHVYNGSGTYPAEVTIENVSGQTDKDSENINVTNNSITDRKIAFERDHEIYTINSDGTVETRVTYGDYLNFSPEWSPDGNWIAVVRREWRNDAADRGNQIWLMRPDGSEARPVTDVENVIHRSLVWSPDSSYLLFQAYVIQPPSTVSEVRALNIQTGELTTIVSPGNYPSWAP